MTEQRPTPSDVSAEGRVEALHHTYVEAAHALKAFVEDSRRAITELSAKTTAIGAKVQNAQELLAASETVPVRVEMEDGAEDGESMVRLELTAGEVGALVDLVDWRLGVLSRYPSMLLNMAFIYLVALFDALASDVLREVLIARPELMKSRRQVTYEAVIEHEASGGLIEFMASREVAALSYLSFSDQVDEYRKRFNVDLLPAGTPKTVLIEAFARRNLLVHNNGVVDHSYLEVLGGGNVRRGDRLDVDHDYWASRFEHLRATSSHLVATLRSKLPASSDGTESA